MIISRFDIQSGVYKFEEKDLVTRFHSHPVLEVVVAKKGTFHLYTPDQALTHLQMGLVLPNQIHRLDAIGATCEIICIECCPSVIKQISVQFALTQPVLGIKAESVTDVSIWQTRLDQLMVTATEIQPDQRIKICLDYVREHLHQSSISLSDLAGCVLLSASRLSHLFKLEMGISIQQYIIWERMKAAINLLLVSSSNLTDAIYQSGFYDTAHFNRHFKAFFGLPPSAVYNNSRIVQF